MDGEGFPANDAIFEQVKHIAGVIPDISGACLLLHFEGIGNSCNMNVKPDADIAQLDFIDECIDLLGRLRAQIIAEREQQVAELGEEGD